jgi:hypothetical protein
MGKHLDSLRRFVGIETPRMTQHQFTNGLRVLQSLDLPELQAVGLFVAPEHKRSGKTVADIRWTGFRNDPSRFLMKCDDPTAAKIWEAMRRRGA